MPDQSGEGRSRAQWRHDRGEAIEDFVSRFAAGENERLIRQMLVTASRLSADGAERGDLKILNAALRELRYAFKVFAPYKDIRKVTIFGSARTKADHPRYLQAKEFAELIQTHGWMVITGAGDGIMRAGHHGATRAASFGVAISLPFEQETNTIIADDAKLVNFKYFFTRKLIFIKEADAIVLFPGGFGTLDEGFEALTLIQTGKALPVPIVLCDQSGGTYWEHWREYVEKELLGNEMIDAADLELFRITDSAEEAVAEVTRFYQRYHSSRFVGELFAIRLNEPLQAETIEEINDSFGDIITTGRYEQHAGPLEGEDNELPDKPRLAFTFDRRSAGRLRVLINLLNDR